MAPKIKNFEPFSETDFEMAFTYLEVTVWFSFTLLAALTRSKFNEGTTRCQ